MSQLLEEIESLRGSMKTLNDFFFDHPELGNEEFLAHGKLTDLLESEGFTVDREVSGLQTAFRAVVVYGTPAMYLASASYIGGVWDASRGNGIG